MGYRRWTAMEEEALHAAVAKHGVGKWMKIVNDPEFSSALSGRNSNSLKDKWRNVIIATRRQSAIDQSSGAETSSAAVFKGYNELIFEALASINDVNGSQIGAIASFIQQSHEVPKRLSRKLNKLVWKGKLVKVGKRFKLPGETQMVAFDDSISDETVVNAARILITNVQEQKGKSKC